MIRNLQAVGLALIAVFAFSAMAASAASAANDVFTSSSGEATDLTGKSKTPTFTLGQEVLFKCETGIYRGTFEREEVTALTVHPTYEENCVSFETFPTTVDTDGCDLILNGDTDANDHASAQIECTEGKEITITVFETAAHVNLLLTISIPPQTIRGFAYDTIEVNNHNALTITATAEEELEGACEGEFCFLVGEEIAGIGYDDDVTTTGWKDTGAFTRDPETHTWTGNHGDLLDFTDHEE